MKKLISLALLLPLAGCVMPAQVPAPLPPVNAAAPMLTRGPFAPEQLDQLLGSIALYPDPLLAIMLPASTSSSDIVLASRYLQAGGDPAGVDAQPWEDSVRSLAHYPQVLRWMDENLAWTRQLGDAFLGQPVDVMNAVQRLRARARAAGTLLSTPQQQVVYEGATIVIVPSQPDVVYVPYYDPAIVYSPPRDYYAYSPGLFFGFSSGFSSGWWMSYGLDWPNRRLWAVDRDDRERFWREHRNDWHRGPSTWHRDRPPPELRAWRPNSEPRPAPYFGPGNTRYTEQPGPRSRDARGAEPRRTDNDARDGAPSGPARAPSPTFVGPLPATSSAPTASRALPANPAFPQATTSLPAQRQDRTWDRQRSDNPRPATTNRPTHAPTIAPAPMPAPALPVAPPPTSRAYTAPMPPPAATMPAHRAPAPRPAPTLQRPAPPPSASPAIVGPPSQAPQAAPAPAPQQQQPPPASDGNDDDGRRRPPVVRQR